MDGLTIDFRTRFPKDTMSISTVSNRKTYQSESAFATSDEHALLKYARDEGFATWAELRSAALPGDREEDWVVTWEGGRPAKKVDE